MHLQVVNYIKIFFKRPEFIIFLLKFRKKTITERKTITYTSLIFIYPLVSLTKFIEKHLCWSLFFNNVAGLRLAILLKKRNSGIGAFNIYFKEHL